MMEKIRKGDKAKYDGYILTADELDYYKELDAKAHRLIDMYDEYKARYK